MRAPDRRFSRFVSPPPLPDGKRRAGLVRLFSPGITTLLDYSQGEIALAEPLQIARIGPCTGPIGTGPAAGLWAGVMQWMFQLASARLGSRGTSCRGHCQRASHATIVWQHGSKPTRSAGIISVSLRE